MGSFGLVRLADVWKMLDHCANGWTKVGTKHYWCIRWSGRTYPSFPLGDHGSRKNPGIQIGHVRKLVRFLGIAPECAGDQIEALKIAKGGGAASLEKSSDPS